ncbi:MAG: DNA internalization-related competence protein ComEC/Rec2 [Vicinamibacteria bacterium]
MRPLLPVCLAFGTGTLAGVGLDVRTGALLLVLAAFALVAAWRAGERALYPLAAAALAVGAACACAERVGYDRTQLRAFVDGRDPEAAPVRLTGVAAADAVVRGGRTAVLLDVEAVEVDGEALTVRGRARVDVGGETRVPEIGEGRRVTLWAQLRLPRASGTPGAYDPAAEARQRGVHALGYCKSAQLIVLGPAGDGFGLRTAAARVRSRARSVLLAHVLPGPEQALVRAMVLGDQQAVDDDTADAFRAAGTYHVLAISGAQVALFASLLAWALARVGCPRLPGALLLSLALVFYAELVGGNVPVARATAMAVVLLAGRAFDLDSDVVNLLSLAGLLLLAHRPSSVADVGFQLSFGATLGIVLLTGRIAARWPRLPLRIETAVAASLAAHVALLPLLAVHFSRLSPAAVLLNLAAVPLSATVLGAGLLVLPLAAIAPGLASWMGDAAWIAAHALLRSALAVRALPWLDLRVPAPPAWSVVLFVCALLLCIAGRTRRAWPLAAVGAAGLVFGASPAADGRLRVTLVDVGQGDAILLQSPRGRAWMIDAGGAFEGGFDVGEAVVSPYLWSQGIRSLDRILVTHAHPDHAGGVPALLAAFGVGEVWEGPAPRRDRGYALLDEALRKRRVARRAVRIGTREEWDGVSIEVLGPRPSGRPPWVTRNDDSVVLSVRYGQVTVLLAGDVEARGEQALPPTRALALKAPHHGSKSSSSARLLSDVGPRVALVSAGYRNRFGHPHPDVLARYRDAHALVLRTDRDGCVTLATDGSRTWLRSERLGAVSEVPPPAP